MGRVVVEANSLSRNTELALRVSLNGPKGKKLRGKAAADYVKKNVLPKLDRMVREHYNHAIDAVGEVLNDPMLHTIDTSGRKRIPFRGYRDTSRKRRFQTSTEWRQLSHRHVVAAQHSSSFWRKGRLDKDGELRYRQLADIYAGAVSSGVDITRGSTSVKPLKSGRVEVRTTISFGRLPVPLDRLITSSFVGGRELRVAPLPAPITNSARNSIRRLRLLEPTRPFVSGMAARLGEMMLKDLRKSL